MKPNSSIYLISNSPQFNKDAVPVFESFSIENSSLLYSTLTLNHDELFSTFVDTHRLVYCFDELDKDFLPNGLKNSQRDLIFSNTETRQAIIKILSDKFFGKSNKNLIVFSNSIGMNDADIRRAFNLLSIDDEAVVIGRTNNNKAAFIGFNTFNSDLFYNIDWNNCNYDYLLTNVNKHENFVHVLGNYMYIDNVEDFKNLYKELSKKESLTYCSQKMHEEFTNLFIEYKELLK